MAPAPSLSVANIPSDPTVFFEDSSFFRKFGTRCISLPNLSEVLAKSMEQNSQEAHRRPNPPPVFFESIRLAVKFGRDGTVSICEGQNMWAIRRLLPRVPVPEIYGWSTEDGYVLLYMEMIKGPTVETCWPTMIDDERQGFWRSLQTKISELRTLTQESPDPFLGRINRSAYYDISITNPNRSPAGPFNHVADFHNWLSLTLRRLIKQHWPGIEPEEIPDPYRELLPDDAKVVFTHADLHPSNIMVDLSDPSTIIAIIDWEQSGWYPDYLEFCKAEYTAKIGSEWHEYMLRFLEEPIGLDGFIEYTRALGY